VTIYHHITVDGVEHEWPVDPGAAAKAMTWAARAPDVLKADLAGMAEYFPHWVLAGCNGDRLTRCPRCATILVPSQGRMRCAQCGEEGKVNGLLWLGHIPTLARSEPSFHRRQKALRKAGFAEVRVGDATYLLVPLTVRYPAEWPNVKPTVRYARRWLKALGVPHSSAANHLIQGGKACIFGWSQWTAMPIHAVLQQRMINHITSLLKVAAGQKPGKAFIGRGHHTSWGPER
jgi:hypothetical protein